MKALKILNTIALGIPILFVIIGLFNNGYFITALVSTMATGFIQVLLGLFLLYKCPKNIHYKIYIITVFIFLILWNWCPIINKIDYFTYILVNIPPILATYLSILIYTKNELPNRRME